MRGRFLDSAYPLGNDYHITVHADSPQSMVLTGFYLPPHSISPQSIQCAELFILGNRNRVRPPNGLQLLSDRNGIREFSAGKTVYTEWFGKGQSITSRSTHRALITLPHARRLNPEYLTRLIVRPIIDRLIADSFLILHAAGVSCGGRAYILVGNAGSGKSTMLHGLLEKGMTFLGDDRILVQPSHPPCVCRYPEYIRVPFTKWGPKHRVLPREPFVMKSSPAAIILLNRTEGDMNILPLGPAETAARIMRHVIVAGGVAEDTIDTMAKLAESTTGYLIRGWDSRQNRLAAICDIIAANNTEDCNG